MKNNGQLPKSVMKALRYIRQDAPANKIGLIEKQFQKALTQRKEIEGQKG
ncbi:hypothetical protein [Thalassobacillus pellis]|nr:hypothetical protein [Thalassobacillus pellis]MBM7551672.1 hypothetical protein [Thalassobacillus pellis]